MSLRLAFFLSALLMSVNSSAQAPAAPPPPADASPLYVVTYVESKPSARNEAAALLKSYRDASRSGAGNLRAVVARSVVRPGQFVVVSAWKDKAAWDAHLASPGTQAFRDKLAALRNAPTDDRFHNALSVGPLDNPGTAGAVYVVTHIDVIPPRKDDAVAAIKTLGDASRNASGNLRYEIVQQTNRPNHFTAFEVWRSREAFDAQGMSAHMREFRDKLSAMQGALYDERLYELLD
jgi:quinol monooxygenase YgiN